MTLAWELTIRLVSAGLLGAVIGIERELRAKGAGIRTHVLVALGASLFMLISQFGFPEAERFDAARIAAGVVGGLGFLGGGLIMKTKSHISGLTTAAGLWVTGAIGLAMGSGMYELAILCAVLMIVCMEVISHYTVRVGHQEVSIVLASADEKALHDTIDSFGKQVHRINFSRHEGKYQAEIFLVMPKRLGGLVLFKRLTSLEGVDLISME